MQDASVQPDETSSERGSESATVTDGTPVDGMTLEQGVAEAPGVPYPLVAVGASAGGLQAFRELLEHLPERTGMTYVLVTHLAPDHRSYLTEIMERHTRMPVQAVEDGQTPRPDHVYILLPNQYVRMEGGKFRLEERRADDKRPATIDIFFRSVASDQKNYAIGVILSDADSDGASGLKTIKGEGGFALVQTPESATHGSMPRNSIAADHVDLVLSPAEIALELARLANQFTRTDLVPLEQGEAPEGDDSAFRAILRLLRESSGLELRLYKPETLRRRMARRMMLQRIGTLPEYLRVLQIRSEELRTLQEDILINVTRFFRDQEFWDALQNVVLPALLRDRSREKPLRVWCAGCSSGDEAYSLAISLLEFTSEHNLVVPIQIFGTDASERAIDMARTAIYPDTIAGELSAERIRKYFVKVDRGYQISKRVRDLCVFARQNLCNDPPFSHIDILSCRNVMIYFNQALQQQVIATFHYALEPGGYMLLGLSEGLRDYAELFQMVDRKNKIYSKTGNTSHYLDLHRIYRAVPIPPSKMDPADPVSTWPENELQRTADRVALARFAPPGMVIDERMNVLQLRGQMAAFLEPGPGTVSWNLQRVLRSSIATSVWQAVQRAIQEGVAVSTSFLFSDKDGSQQQLQIDVLPITGTATEGSSRCFLVFLQQSSSIATPEPQPSTLGMKMSDDERERLIVQQERDLSATRFHLQSLIQERDGRNQELVSANEEIQAANEELQSTNEELGTTKEELQSANEELQTVNDELQQRNLNLSQTGNDLSNLLTSVNIPLLMLTSDLRIRQFTPPMQRLLSVRATDIGRPISDIRLHLGIGNLEVLLQEVLETLSTREFEVQDDEGRWYLLRIRPYRTSDDKIEGLVLILMDIDQLRRSQQEMRNARNFATAVLECVPLPVLVLRDDLTIQVANTAFCALTHMRAIDLQNRLFPDLLQHLWGESPIAEQLQAVLAMDPPDEFVLEHTSTTSEKRVLLIRAQALTSEGHRVALVVLDDVTVRRQAEILLNLQKSELETAVATAAVTLDRTQEELRRLTAHLFQVQEEERQRVARELHDDISQRLSFLDLLLQGVAAEPGAPEQAGKVSEARGHLQTLNTDVRQLSHHLHPAVLDELGLSPALKILVDDFGAREAMPATYLSRDVPLIASQPAATAIYRIAQEALRNVAKHAGKTHVKVLLERVEQRLRLQVVDLGIGFDQEETESPHGLGLISMKERAHMAHGTLSVRSTLGFGTTVVAEVPFHADA